MAKPVALLWSWRTQCSLCGLVARKLTECSHVALFVLPFFLTVTSCKRDSPKRDGMNGAFRKEIRADAPNVNRIVDSGELIIATLSGPDTYFDYQGRGFGLQYALAVNFAESLGVGVRVEVCSDTLSVRQMLNEGGADVAALQIPLGDASVLGLQAAGATSKDQKGRACSWMVKADARDLAQALNEWFGQGVEPKVEQVEHQRMRQRLEVRRKVRAPFISKEKGLISIYDSYFRQAAAAIGWDWRLMAAQCYQESGFDPNAVSWAGASGLMQLMPSTAAQVGLSQEQLFQPAENVAAAARFLRRLQNVFSGIADPIERVKFVLAAYNAGPGHITDAQALARKYGRDPHSWDDVGIYVRGLSKVQYYRDPVVKHGYMIGDETFRYVNSIMDRWAQYGGNATSTRFSLTRGSAAASQTNPGERVPHKRNRYSREQVILDADRLSEVR